MASAYSPLVDALNVISQKSQNITDQRWCKWLFGRAKSILLCPHRNRYIGYHWSVFGVKYLLLMYGFSDACVHICKDAHLNKLLELRSTQSTCWQVLSTVSCRQITPANGSEKLSRASKKRIFLRKDLWSKRQQFQARHETQQTYLAGEMSLEERNDKIRQEIYALLVRIAINT